MMTITYRQYYDKVLGGWVGKCAGGILGAPIEGYKTFNEIPLSDELFANNFANDDLDLQVLWLDMVLKKGPNVREADFTEHWLQHVAFPWNEYGIATRNIKLGLDNPDSGKHNNWYWKESMGSPIRSEIWGMLCPGDPERAAFYASLDSRLDHDGFSVEAEQFLSACAALAFTTKDTQAIFSKALTYIDQTGICAQLVSEVMQWYQELSYETTAGRIKSLYGDADFTSAPMNIGFTILALLRAQNDFNQLIGALHFGHDSDCIVSTAGALLGLINGYDEIPQRWRERVGDDLLVSPEIKGIDTPANITELTDRTCRAGLLFLEQNSYVSITTEGDIHKPTIPDKPPFALRSEVVRYPDIANHRGAIIRVHTENFTDISQAIQLKVDSPVFRSATGSMQLFPRQEGAIELDLPLKVSSDLSTPRLPYTIEVTLDRQKFTFLRGIPFYGSWLLLGPFIKDNPDLAPMDEQYPDHGLSSMPSVQYMNHDRARPEEEFIQLTLTEIQQTDWTKKPFGAQTIFPSSMQMDLGQYFYGKGERTLYLLTEVTTQEAVNRWLCLGCSNYLTVWLDGTELFRTDTPKRRWPGAEAIELYLREGSNALFIRLDFINDDFRLDIGLKEHNHKHHHQCQWDTELLWSAPSLG